MAPRVHHQPSALTRLRPLALAIGLAATGASIPAAIAQDATYDTLTVSGTAILSALQVSGAATFDGAATFNDSLTVGGVNVANAISANASDISTNTSAISTNTSDISTNTSNISTNTSQISALTGRVGDNETEIANVKATASAGWGISAEGGTEENVAPGGAVDFSGDGNIEVGRSGTDLTFGLADDVEVAGSLSVTGGPSITVDGIDAGGKAITNVAAGNLTATSSDVVIGSQIYDLFIEEGARGVRYFRANSMEPDSQALGAESIAIGPNTVAEGGSSLAAGDGASITATGEGAIALGQGASAGGDPLGGAGAIAVGRDSVAGANSAVALGDAAQATAGNATAVGAGAAASGDGSIALGDADATGSNAFAAGTGAYAGSPGGIALGTGAGVGTDGSVAGDKTHHIAIGTEAGRNVVGNQTTAIGYSAGSDITGDHNVAVGSHAGQNLQGDFNVAIGHEANRDAGVVERATAVGGQTQAGRNGVSVGYGATSEDSGVALGANTSADNLGVALGRNATAEGGSVALGSGSAARSTDAAGTGYLTGSDFTDGTVVSVGNTNQSGVRTTRRIVNVADGSQDYDAVNVGQLKGAQQSVANLVGGNVTLGANGSFEGYVVELQDSSGTSHQYATVAEAINAVSSGGINVLPGDAVIYNPDGTVTVAEGVVGTDAVNVEQLNRVVAENGVKYFSVNSSEPANRDNAEASGTDAIAIGPATSADGASSLAAGHLAHSAGDESVALGHRVEALGNDSTAIGSESDAYGDGGVAIGLLAKSQGENSIVMGTRAQADPKTTDATVDNAVVIGTDAEATADNGIAVGESALASEVRAVAQGFDAHATADDAMAFGSNSRASGTSAQASGTNASASGTNAQASGTDASASGLNAQASGTDSIGYATDGIAMGTGAVAGFSDPNGLDPERNTAGIAIGKQSLADEQHALALGVEAQARAQSATAIGDGAEATAAAQDGLAVGSGARVTAQNASAFGQGAEAVAGEALAMGSDARAAAQGASAIGEGAHANHQGSVALGSGAVTAAAVGTLNMTVDKNTYDFAGTSPVATVSVGTAGAERTLTNVAAGRVSATSTDAINGSQLYGTNQAVNALADNLDTAGGSVADVLGGNAAYDTNTHQVTMSDVGGTGEDTVHEAIEYAAQGWDVSAQGGAEENVAPGGSVDFSSTDGNIAISRTGTDLVFNLEDDIAVGGSVSVGSDTVIDGDSVTTNELSVGGGTFTVEDGNAIYNGSEVANQADGLSFAGNTGGAIDKTLGDTTPLTVSGELAAGDASSGANLRVDSDGNQLNLVMARNLTELDSVTTGDSVLNTGGLTVDDGAGSRTELGAGSLSVAGAGNNTIAIDGGAGDITGLTNTDLDGADFAQAGRAATEEQLDLVNQTANAGWNLTGSGVDEVNIGPDGAVDFQGDGNISVAQNGVDDDGQIDITLNPDLNVDSVTAGNSTLDTDGLTVDDGAGNVTAVTASGTSVTDGTNSTEYGADGMTIAGGPSVTSGGIDAGDLKITSVADGAINSTSSDAINGSQLQAAGDSLASNVLGGNADYTGNDFSMSDVGGTGESTIDDAIRSANTAANAGWNVADANGNSHNIGPNGKVTFEGDSNVTVTESGVDDDAKVQVALNDDIAVDSVTAGNSVLDTSGLSVDDGAGNVTKVTTAGTSVTDGAGNSTEYGADGMTIAGGPSVTSGGIDASDLKITSVADGDVNATSSDAINGSQLQAAGDSLASNVLGGNADYTGNDFTMSDVGGTGESTIDDAIRSANTTANAGWNVADTNGNSHNIGPNGKVTFDGDSNVTVTESGADDDAKVQVALNDDITVDSVAADSVTTGNSTLDTEGLTVDDGAGNVTEVTTAGTSVTDGTNSTEYGADGMTIAGGPSVTSGGIDAAGNKITNVADGAINSTSSDAINGSQLQAAGDSLASNVLGGNADYTGNDFTMSDVGGTGEDTIDDAIRSANTAATAGWDISAQGSNPTNVGPGDSVDLSNSDGNIEVSKTATDNDVTFDLAANLTADSLTTGDSRLDTDGLTVDDGAGNVTEVTTAGTSVTDGTNSTEYGADGMTIAGGPSVTTSGIDAAGNKITNVADGDINASSGDAINGSQLQAAGDSLASNVLGGNADYTGNDFAMSDVGGTGEDTIDDAIRSANTAATAGWNVADTNGNSHNIGPNGKVTFEGDSNVTVTESGVDDDAKVQVALNDNITVDSVTTGDSRLDTDGLTVDDGAGNVTEVTTAGTSVTDGTNSTEYGADGMTIAGGPSVTTSGIDAAGNKITNVADGAINSTSSDAINGSQLQAAGDSLASNVLGGDAAYTGNDFTMSDVGGTGESTIDDAIRSANTAATAGWNVADTNGNSHNIGPNGKVTFEGDSNVTVTESGVDDDAKVQVALNDDIAVDSVTTGDSTLDTDGLTVDDGAGNVTAVTASGTSVTDGTNSTEYGADGMTIAGGPSVTTSGINAGNQVVSNVANGVADTDAVNVSQLTGLADTPLTFAGDSGTNVDRKLGETLNLMGGETDATALVDGNIGVVADGSDTLSIQLAENIDLGETGSVTTGDSVLDTDGLVVNDNTANPTATTTVEAGTITLAANPITGPANQIVIDANSGTIGGLTNTTFDPNSFTSGQAATEDQLGQVYTVANAGWHVSVDGEGVMADGSNNVGPDGVVDFTSDDNIVIDRTGTDLAFGLADSITLGDGDSAITVDGENGLVSVGDTIVNGAGVTVGDDVSLDNGGLTIDGGPSVTVGGIDAGGQVVTNVAAGEVSSTSTDAINGSQLYEVQQVANAGWNLSGSGADAVNIGPNGAVDFRGDSNITVSQAGVDQDGVIEVALNDAITLGAGDTAVTVDGENGLVSVGDTIMDGDGVSIGDSVSLDGSGLVIAGGPSVTIGGIDAGGLQVTNVASGLGGQTLDQISGGDLMNAVNVGDLQQVAGEIGQDVAAAKTEVEAGSNITVSQTTGDDGQTIYTVETERDVDFDSINVGSVNIDKDNVDENGNTIIAGVGRGEISADSTDAVNGSQLHEVQEELGDINGALDGGMNFAADEGDDVNRTLGDTVAITGDDNITTQTTGDGVQVTLNNELNVDSVTTGKTTVSDAGVTIAGGPSMTADGIDGGGKRITNVAAGVDATDAVNVGQMQELNQRFAQEIHNVHGRISDVERNANAGTASALAASTVPQAWLPGKSMVGVGAGTYEGESAISVGISRLSDNGRWVIQGKVTGDSQSNFGAGIGAGWHW
ncbi:YadA-like family protein [Halomonas alimentaria]|uniref:YadA-like family protein n=1 Tax=Halomonas alimentaria TaxID=147248 RepID=UPI003CD0DD12